jgi:hypothetical protein
LAAQGFLNQEETTGGSRTAERLPKVWRRVGPRPRALYVDAALVPAVHTLKIPHVLSVFSLYRQFRNNKTYKSMI